MCIRDSPITGPRKGTATAVEARANFRELGWTASDWSAGAWWRDVEAGYSTGARDIGQDIVEYGAEMLGQVTSAFGLYARYSQAERGAETLTQAQVTGEWRINDLSTLSAELRRVDEQRLSGNAIGTLGALKYAQRFGTSLEMWGIAQLTLDDDGGQYADNNAFSLGGKYLFGNLSSVGAELTTGDRGNSAQVSAEPVSYTHLDVYKRQVSPRPIRRTCSAAWTRTCITRCMATTPPPTVTWTPWAGSTCAWTGTRTRRCGATSAPA